MVVCKNLEWSMLISIKAKKATERSERHIIRYDCDGCKRAFVYVAHIVGERGRKGIKCRVDWLPAFQWNILQGLQWFKWWFVATNMLYCKQEILEMLSEWFYQRLHH